MKKVLLTRIIPQDRGRGWMILAGWTKPLVRRTCEDMYTIGNLSLESIAKKKEYLLKEYRADEIFDLTPKSLYNKLEKEANAKANPSS
jgi:hypothetical protein